MPYTASGKNLMLSALKGINPTTPITHVGLFDGDTALTGVTGAAASDLLTKSGHGLSNGELVVLRDLAGGNGLFEEMPYFVVGVVGDDFQLSKTPGGNAIDFSTDITDVSVVRLVEVSGGSPAYARAAIAFDNPIDGLMDDSTNGAIFDVPAGATVDYAGFFSASSGGTLLAIDPVEPESFGAQGNYTLTDAKLHLNGDEV